MAAEASLSGTSSSSGNDKSRSSSADGLAVIALVSGGKDSFFSALHCLQNGHRLVALANLYPAQPSVSASPLALAPASASDIRPDAVLRDLGNAPRAGGGGGGVVKAKTCGGQDEDPDHGRATAEAEEAAEAEEEDLNSFMYQTVGHQVIPAYAEATGLPLYRQPIVGAAVQSRREYSTARVDAAAGREEGASGEEQDETEAMIPLLRAVMARHPEANALSAGAILSTYQRTRVESVALRLGLVPLAYLWKYPVHPPPSTSSSPGGGTPGPAAARDEAQLLFDMATAGLDARIIKVASGGLDESFLWENVAGARGVTRLKRAMGRFVGAAGADTGAVLGEGGEFETLVVDGPARLFKKRVVVEEKDRVVVREGGGTAWLKVKRARTEEKTGADEELNVRIPDLLDERFAAVLEAPSTVGKGTEEVTPDLGESDIHLDVRPDTSIQTWAVVRPETTTKLTITEETNLLTDEIRARLAEHNLTPTSILSTVIVLRSMADFPAINTVYGSLFTEPNPPSRVTISCGDLLPHGSGNIAIYLTVQTGDDADRQGLHVQSRSYWAPANIGPYSQAITFPAAAAAPGNSSSSARVVHIAGQIPLIPASMELPSAADDGLDRQLTLSLQHLWRVGAEMGVRWWTSGAVYFPRAASSSSSPSSSTPRDKALLAHHIWREAHLWSPASSSSSDSDDDEDGPDLWDRKFNPQYMNYTDKPAAPLRLPDYSLLLAGNTDSTAAAEAARPVVPFFLAAEVDELPRGAAAEWHTHAGLGGDPLSPSLSSSADASVRVVRTRRRDAAVVVEHCVLRLGAPDGGSGNDSDSDSDADAHAHAHAGGGGGGCVHSIAAVGAEAAAVAAAGETALTEQVRELDGLVGESTVGAGAATPAAAELRASTARRPYLVYVDTTLFSHDQITCATRDDGLAVVPCASLWGGTCGGVGGDDGGEVGRLGVVALYRTFLS